MSRSRYLMPAVVAFFPLCLHWSKDNGKQEGRTKNHRVEIKVD
jgi:hypothetical protein